MASVQDFLQERCALVVGQNQNKTKLFSEKIMTITVFSFVSPNGRSGFFLIFEFVDSVLVLKSWNRPWVQRRFLSALNTLK
jgi:hypothetical protein